MSFDFLRSYTIPPLQKTDAEMEEIDKIEQMAEQPTDEKNNLTGISNNNRYVAPGKQDCGTAIPVLQNPLKRKHSSEESVKCGDSKLAIFVGRDPSFPDELNLLINPLTCLLCKIKINSLKSAKDHYESKSHDRKVTAWIAENCGDNPPIVKRFVKEGLCGPDAFHCELCDLPLTSLTHANQHYSGRKHRLVANKISQPSGQGYYDNEGKWVRTKTVNVNIPGRFGIGVDFVQPEIGDKCNGNESEKEKNELETKALPAKDTSICCTVCNINITSASQMNMHLGGAKHRKNLVRASTSTTEMSATGQIKDLLVDCNSLNNPNDSILASINEQVDNTDYSMYRTPTGSYYCEICNISILQIAALKQHIQGKKHTKKLTEIKTTQMNST